VSFAYDRTAMRVDSGGTFKNLQRRNGRLESYYGSSGEGGTENTVCALSTSTGKRLDNYSYIYSDIVMRRDDTEQHG